MHELQGITAGRTPFGQPLSRRSRAANAEFNVPTQPSRETPCALEALRDLLPLIALFRHALDR